MIGAKSRNGIALALAFLAIVGGLDARAQEYAPLPEKLLAARNVYLINDSGDLKAYDAFFKELKKWARLTVVSSREAADVVAVLTSNAEYSVSVGTATSVDVGNVTTTTATAVSVPSSFLHLRIFDRASGEPLWSDSAEKWIASGHAPSKLVGNLKKRVPKR